MGADAARLGPGDVGGVGRQHLVGAVDEQVGGRRAGRRPSASVDAVASDAATRPWPGGRARRWWMVSGTFTRLSAPGQTPRVASVPDGPRSATDEQTCRAVGRALGRPPSTTTRCGPGSHRRGRRGRPGGARWFAAEAQPPASRATARCSSTTTCDGAAIWARAGARGRVDGRARPSRDRRPVGPPVPARGCSRALRSLGADGAAATRRTRSTGTSRSSAPTRTTRASGIGRRADRAGPRPLRRRGPRAPTSSRPRRQNVPFYERHGFEVRRRRSGWATGRRCGSCGGSRGR